MHLKETILTPTQAMFPEIQKELGTGMTDKIHYLFYPGRTQLILQAHIDTVRKIIPQLSFEKKIIKANGILGADDRAGVYAILQAWTKLDKKKRPSLLFTNFEESGGQGMKKFVKHYKKTLSNITLLIAVDRQGANEFVYYNAIHSEVKNYIKSFGYVEEYGTYSDCQNFTAKTRIPSVNVSCGYYGQHTPKEELHIDELELTINRIVDICKDPLKTLYPVEKETYTFNYSYGYYDGYPLDTYKNKKCGICDSQATLQEVIDDGFRLDICSNCYQTYYRDYRRALY